MKKMRLSKKCPQEENKVFKRVTKHIKTQEEMFSMMLTYMGMMSIMLDFISETYGSPERIHELPERTKYALSQAVYHYKLLGAMVRDEIKDDGIDMRYMPISDNCWEDKDQISQRMVLVVKELHRQLQEEGKL
jgi:hypothetical protein